MTVCKSMQGKLYICMEYAAGGNLYDYIREQSVQLSEERIWQLFIQVCKAAIAIVTNLPFTVKSPARCWSCRAAACWLLCTVTAWSREKLCLAGVVLQLNHAACLCAAGVQMLLGLSYMHGRKILHRDFKTANVFLDKQLNVRLGDLGVAKVCSRTLFINPCCPCCVIH